MADGSARDTIPCRPAWAPRGQQDWRGTLCPDDNGELPWPMVLEYGTHGTLSILTRFSLNHRQTPCLGECDEFESCPRHEHTAHIAEAAMQIRTILDAFEKRCGVPASLAAAETLREDVITLAMGRRRDRRQR